MNISAKGCPLLVKSFIACGTVTLSTDGGVEVISLSGVKSTDIALVTLVSDDSVTSITHLHAACTEGTLTITRTDDGSSADDAVAQYMIIRPASQ